MGKRILFERFQFFLFIFSKKQEISAAVKYQKPIVVIKDVYFAITEVPERWSRFKRILLGPKYISYGAYYAPECAMQMSQIRANPKDQIYYYSPEGKKIQVLKANGRY